MLLFPGDAQVGNWESWHEVELAREDTTPLTATAAVRFVFAAVTSTPAPLLVVIEPVRACGFPQIVIMSVDLPAPFAPISATISPSKTSRSTPLSARIFP